MKTTPSLQAAHDASAGRAVRMVRLHHVLVAMPVASIVAQKAGYAGAAEAFLVLAFVVFGLVMATALLVSHVSFADVKRAVKVKFGGKDKAGPGQ